MCASATYPVLSDEYTFLTFPTLLSVYTVLIPVLEFMRYNVSVQSSRECKGLGVLLTSNRVLNGRGVVA